MGHICDPYLRWSMLQVYHTEQIIGRSRAAKGVDEQGSKSAGKEASGRLLPSSKSAGMSTFQRHPQT